MSYFAIAVKGGYIMIVLAALSVVGNGYHHRKIFDPEEDEARKERFF